MKQQDRLERLKKNAELAREDFQRVSARLAELRRIDPDNLVEIAMMQPMVDDARARQVHAEERLRAAGGGVKHRL